VTEVDPGVRAPSPTLREFHPEIVESPRGLVKVSYLEPSSPTVRDPEPTVGLDPGVESKEPGVAVVDPTVGELDPTVGASPTFLDHAPLLGSSLIITVCRELAST